MRRMRSRWRCVVMKSTKQCRVKKKDTVKTENRSGGEDTVDGVRKEVEEVWSRCLSPVFV